MRKNIFAWTGWLLVFFILIHLAVRDYRQTPDMPDHIRWYPVEKNGDYSAHFRVEGLPWQEVNPAELFFARLPVDLRDPLLQENRAAWFTSLAPSGARIRFRTRSRELWIRAVHGSKKLDMDTMSKMSFAGMDLYEGAPGDLHYRGTSYPQHGLKPYAHAYFRELPETGEREWTLYLPSYAWLAELAIGLEPDGELLAAPAPLPGRPMVFYGTSITQSGSASRGSNGYVPLLGRRLSREVINLGFSGAGLGELEVAKKIAEIDASVYVVDAVGNMAVEVDGISFMEKNYKAFVGELRRVRPDTPVILMSKPGYASVSTAWGEEIRETDESYAKSHVPMMELLEDDPDLYFFDTRSLIPSGEPEHPSVDGIHLNDEGFRRIADGLEPLLRQIVK